ncbi:MAG TPA: hypothetical protein VLS53_07730 [Candidatus Dormibacteraeota bacterium]|nr:hypothetical protein [Candidatus Dormibacteraeota bacterium]
MNASLYDSVDIGDTAPGGGKKQITQVVNWRSDMEAVYSGWVWSRQRLVALFLGLAVIALLAGGTGGYLVRGATTLVVTHTITKTVAIPATQPSSVEPRTSGGYVPAL